jgi:hypothetical protein
MWPRLVLVLAFVILGVRSDAAPLNPGPFNADSDDCGQRFRSKPDADSDPWRTGIPMIPSRVVVDVAYGVS